MSIASAFLNSLGLCVHAQYTNTPYGNTQWVAHVLNDIGIKHVRDGTPDPIWIADYARDLILKAGGIDFTACTDMRTKDLNPMTATEWAKIYAAEASAFRFIEGPNEYDDSGDKNWAVNVAAYQNELDGSIAGALPVIAPSIAHGANYAAVGDLSADCDYGNIHAYYGADSPSNKIAQYIAWAHSICNKPAIVTETGYHNALNTTGTGGWEPVDELTAAKYLLRTLFLNWNAGIFRTFLYELVDEFPEPALSNPGSHYGLIRNDLTYKPAAIALKNLIAAFADSGTGTPHGIGIGYQAASSLANVQHATFSKSNGHTLIAIWQEVLSWKPRVPIAVSLMDVEIKTSLTAPTFAQLTDPITGTVTPLVPKQNMWIEVPDYPVMLEVG